MNVIKLTLTLNEDIMTRAKNYARQKKMTLSQLIEFYLSSLNPSSKKKDQELASLTKELANILPPVRLKEHKKILTDTLIEKYL